MQSPTRLQEDSCLLQCQLCKPTGIRSIPRANPRMESDILLAHGFAADADLKPFRRLGRLIGRQSVSRPSASILFLGCTTSVWLGCSADGHLARLLPSLSAPCGREPHRCIRQIPRGRWRICRLAQQFFGSAACASRRGSEALGILSGGVGLRCAGCQAAVSVPSRPAPGHSRIANDESGKTHCDVASMQASCETVLIVRQFGKGFREESLNARIRSRT